MAYDSRQQGAEALSKLVCFEWHGGGSAVSLTGSFLDWSHSGVAMTLAADGRTFAVALRLKRGVRVEYKFIVVRPLRDAALPAGVPCKR